MKGKMMIGWIELTHPQVKAYLRQETLHTFEIKMGRQNQTNRQIIGDWLTWARDYVGSNFDTLLPKGRYSFQEIPHFHQVELQELKPLCEVVFFLSIACSQQKRHDTCEDALMLSLLRTSVLDSTRQYIKQFMLPTLYKSCCGESLVNISPCFGPGLFSAELSEINDYFSYLQIPTSLAILKGDMIEPVASFAGAYYGLTHPWNDASCKHCMNHNNCLFCMNYNEKR